jgi:hypothetical protein
LVDRYRSFLFIMIFYLSALLIYGEETISQEKAFVNRNFRVYIKTDIPYSRDLNVEFNLSDNSELVQFREPYLRSYDGLTDNDGEYIYEDLTEIVLSINSSKGDIFYFENLRLYREKFELIIPPFPVIVYNRDEQNIEYPIELYWTTPREKIYLGDTLFLILNIRYMENLEFPEQISMAKPNMGNLEKVDLSGKVESFPMGDSQIYAYPLESWYFTASESGRVSIKGGFVRIKGLRKEIPNLDFEVLPLPDEIKSSGAVGAFSLKTTLTQQSLKEGDIVSLFMRVEGVGNLPYLNLPEVTAFGLDLIGTKDKEEITPGEEGYSGFREREFRFQAGKDRTGTLEIEPFYWINPLNDKINNQKIAPYHLNITEQNNRTNGSIEILTVDEIKIMIIKEWLNGPYLWLLVIPGFLYFILNLFLLNKKNSKSLIILIVLSFSLLSFSLPEWEHQSLLDGEALVDKGNYDQALAVYQSIYMKKPSAAIQYNMAVVNHMKGNLVECELLLRSALLTMKDNKDYHSKLLIIEELYGLKDQFSLHGVLNAFQLKIILILLIDTLLISYSVYLKKKKTLLFFINSFLLIFIFSLTLTLVVVDWGYNRIQGVVVEQGGNLKRIPERTGNEWLNLKAGTTVHVKAEKTGYYFIETGYGLKGWLPVNDLILVEEGYY